MLTFIVLSSDGYSDCWNPFFRQFDRYFPKLEGLEIILSTNTKDYSYEGLNINVLKNGTNFTWSKRYLLCLKEAKHEIVLPLSEDFLLKSMVDENIFRELLRLIIEEDVIDHIRLLSKSKLVYKTVESNFNYLDEITKTTRKRFIFSPGLWKKSVLEKYLLKHESPWIAERMGDLRAKIYDHGFYSVSNNYVEKESQIYDTFFSGVIYKGKCAHYVVDFLKKEGYSNILKRGIMSKKDMKKARSKARRKLIFDIFPITYSLLGVVFLYFKHKLKLI